jgi:hypothetical protein
MSFQKSSNHIYYTSNLRKSSHSGLDEYRNLQFQDIRSVPILEKASDYEMSIIRFQVDTMSLPVFIPEIVPSQPNPFLTIYSVNLSYLTGGVETFLAAPVSVIFTKRDFTDSDPNPPSSNPLGLQSDTRSYYSYSYTDIIEDINTAFATAKTSLDILFPVLVPYEPPTLVWDTTLSKADLYCRADAYSENLASQIRVHISKSLYPLISSFPVNKSPVSANRAEYRIRTYNFGVNEIVLFYGINSALKIEQQYSTIEPWCPYSSLAFTSNLIPFQSESIAPPLIYENGSVRQINSGTNNYFNIIGDITSQDFSYRSSLLYLPTAEYRMVSLFGSSPVYKVDFNIYMQLKNGSFVPFYLHSNASVSLKVLFRKIGS